jgi:choline monooxygenase
VMERDLARASTLPSRYYVDPEIHRAEKEKIFARTWQPVGDVADATSPGDHFTAEIAGEPIVVVRDKDGVLRAFYNVCRHRAGAVADGCGKKMSLQCRYHGWTYGLDGRLMHAPESEGMADFDKARFGLVPIAVDTFGPFVFVNQDKDAPPLATYLGNIPEETKTFGLERLKKAARRDYVIGCNWKVYVDNYLEGYHVPIAHPGLNKALDYSSYRVNTYRYHSEQFAPMRSNPSERALYYWVFPNWMLNIYPDNLSINVVLPLAIDKTLTIFAWYFADGHAREETLAFSHEIQEEDIALCEMVQKGLASRAYDRGRFSVLRENGVHHFQCLVEEFLG